MIEFKNNYTNLLPYDKERYMDFLDDDADDDTSPNDWYGVSIQLNNEPGKDNLIQSANAFEPAFSNVISTLDNGSFWIVAHEYKDLNWFPNDDNNLISLRHLFMQNNIPRTYKGALILAKDDLFKYAKDLISYSYVLSYPNLDISHSKLQFIVKMTAHLTIDLLSTDKLLLDKIAHEGSLSFFKKIEYRRASD